MRTLTLYFTHQFDQDAIEVRVNGQLIFSEQALTTKLLVGLADEASLPVTDQPFVLEISLPTKQLRAQLNIAAGADCQIEIQQAAGELHLLRHDQPLGFL